MSLSLTSYIDIKDQHAIQTEVLPSKAGFLAPVTPYVAIKSLAINPSCVLYTYSIVQVPSSVRHLLQEAAAISDKRVHYHSACCNAPNTAKSHFITPHMPPTLPSEVLSRVINA